ncbi:hypothetical protein MMC25_006397 [Agyrium rufum]|nr:hypothetical protein [Agyrium rufum]
MPWFVNKEEFQAIADKGHRLVVQFHVILLGCNCRIVTDSIFPVFWVTWNDPRALITDDWDPETSDDPLPNDAVDAHTARSYEVDLDLYGLTPPKERIADAVFFMGRGDATAPDRLEKMDHPFRTTQGRPLIVRTHWNVMCKVIPCTEAEAVPGTEAHSNYRERHCEEFKSVKAAALSFKFAHCEDWPRLMHLLGHQGQKLIKPLDYLKGLEAAKKAASGSGSGGGGGTGAGGDESAGPAIAAVRGHPVVAAVQGQTFAAAAEGQAMGVVEVRVPPPAPSPPVEEFDHDSDEHDFTTCCANILCVCFKRRNAS